MIAVISQPRFMPALNYLQRMVAADVFVYLDTVQYTPRDWENRNKIKTSTGPQWISVPVKSTGREMKISETFIDNEQDWGKKIMGSLRHAYAQAPFYKDCAGFFEETFAKKWEKLTDLNIYITGYACKMLETECKFVMASDLNVSGQGEQLLIDLCKKTGADSYLSGPLGKNYIQPENWQRAGINLAFDDYAPVEYPQVNGPFAPWMCFADLLFNTGPEAAKFMRAGAK